MLKVATAMIGTDPRLKTLDQGLQIIDYVFDECLFPQPYATDETGASVTPSAAKCQSEGSRSAAFGYLEESSRDNPETLRYVITKIRKHFDRGKGRHNRAGLNFRFRVMSHSLSMQCTHFCAF